MTLSIITLNIINNVMLSAALFIMLSVIILSHNVVYGYGNCLYDVSLYAECLCGECGYAECLYAEYHHAQSL